MKATIELSEATEGNLSVVFNFDPPMTPDTKESVVTKAVLVIIEGLKEHTTVLSAEAKNGNCESRIITP